MRQLIFLFSAILFLSLTACNTAPKSDKAGKAEEATEETAAINTLTEKEVAEGWILMFDGETTEGWREYDAEVFPDTGWHIENGTLACENSGNGEAGFGGDILYDKQFTNFHFKVEWMIEEGGNSGIFYLARELSVN